MEQDRVYTKAERIATLLYKTWRGAALLGDRFELQDLLIRSDKPTWEEAHSLAHQMRESDAKPALFASVARFAA